MALTRDFYLGLVWLFLFQLEIFGCCGRGMLLQSSR